MRSDAFCRRWAVAALFTLVTGCGKGPASPLSLPRPAMPYYSIMLMNRSGRVADCTIFWGPHRLHFGKGLGGDASDHGIPYEVPAIARVAWITEDAVTHETEVKVPQVPQARLKNVTFCVVILPDDSVKLAEFSKEQYYEEHRQLELARNGGPAYVVGVQTATGAVLTDVWVSFDPYDIVASLRLDRGVANNGWYFAVALPYSVTNTARVRWTTSDGTKHEKVVPVKLHMPGDLNGICIGFMIGEGEVVRVRALPWEKRKEWIPKDMFRADGPPEH